MIPVGTLCMVHMPPEAVHGHEFDGHLVTIVRGRRGNDQRFTPPLYCRSAGEWAEYGSPPFLVPIAPPGDPDKIDTPEEICA